MRFFADKAVTEPQFNVLAALVAATTPPNQQELADRLVVDKSAISGLLARMEKRNLIERAADPADRRRMIVRLTPAGRRTYEQLEAPYLEVVRSIMGAMDTETVEMLNRSLEALRRSICGHLQSEGSRP